MSAPMFASQPQTLGKPPVAFRGDVDTPKLHDDGSLFSRQLAVIPGMLSSLDSLSAAGQRYIMTKIVSFIHLQAGRVAGGLSVRNQRTFAELVAQLKREWDRLTPDAHEFARRADSLVVLLSATSELIRSTTTREGPERRS